MQDMLYRPVPVPPHLIPWVRRLMLAMPGDPIDLALRQPPTGYGYIGWVFGGAAEGLLDGRPVHTISGGLHIAGPVADKLIETRFSGRFGHIVAQCTALGFAELTGRPGHEGRDQVAGLSAYVGRDIPGAALSGDDAGAVIAAFVARLTALSADAAPAPAALHRAVHVIEARDGDLPIAQAARAAGQTQTAFSRSFAHWTGLTPKRFARVMQLTRALEALYTSDEVYLAQLAVAAGYFDQAHFSHAIRLFLGQSPMGFLRGKHDLLPTFLGQPRIREAHPG